MSKPNIRITKESLYQYAVITLGALVLALGQLVFIKPLHIPLGGVSGVALVANYLWKLPIGLVSIVLNLPLFVLGWRTMGREFFYKTVYAAVSGRFEGFSGILQGAAIAHGQHDVDDKLLKKLWTVVFYGFQQLGCQRSVNGVYGVVYIFFRR